MNISKEKFRKFAYLMTLLLLIPVVSVADVLTKEIVRLYSDGKLVDEWKAIEKGRMEGPCYVFRVRKGAREPEIRVCGTFSVEETR